MNDSQPSPKVEWKPVRGRATWAIRLLVLGIVVDLVAVLSGWMELSLLGRAASGNEVSVADADASDIRQGFVGIAQFVVFFVSAIMFIRWLRRVTANLPALSTGRLEYGTGWATGGWFVPIMFLWRPYQVVKQAWERSDPMPPVDRQLSTDEGAFPMIDVWWAVWIVNNIASQVAFRASLGAESIGEIQFGSRVTFANDLVSVLAGLCAIVVVRGITNRHVDAAERRNLDPAGSQSSVVATPISVS